MILYALIRQAKRDGGLERRPFVVTVVSEEQYRNNDLPGGVLSFPGEEAILSDKLFRCKLFHSRLIRFDTWFCMSDWVYKVDMDDDSYPSMRGRVDHRNGLEIAVFESQQVRCTTKPTRIPRNLISTKDERPKDGQEVMLYEMTDPKDLSFANVGLPLRVTFYSTPEMDVWVYDDVQSNPVGPADKWRPI